MKSDVNKTFLNALVVIRGAGPTIVRIKEDRLSKRRDASAFSLMILISELRIGDAKKRLRCDFLDAFHRDFLVMSDESSGKTDNPEVIGGLVVLNYAESFFCIARAGIGNPKPDER